MAKIKLIIELEYDTNVMHDNDEEGFRWFVSDVLQSPLGLVLHSNNIGDAVGTCKVLKVIPTFDFLTDLGMTDLEWNNL